MAVRKADWYGRYRFSFVSGLVTVVAAGTNSAGRIAVVRWGSTTAYARVRKVKAYFTLLTAFGAAQEMAVAAFIARSYTASNSGGTALTLTGDNGKISRSTDTPTTGVTSARVATTTDLATGTSTLDTQPIATARGWMAAVGNQFGFSESFVGDEVEPGAGLELKTDEGVVIRNEILMGATGVGRWDIDIELDEFRINPFA